VKTALIALTRELGFELCRIAPCGPPPHAAEFRQWLADGRAGDMAWLERNQDRRTDPQQVVPGAQSVIVLGMNYWQGEGSELPPSLPSVPSVEHEHDPRAPRGIIARYAWGDDYHDVLIDRLEALLAWMREQHPEPFEARAYVDTGPVQERVYAQHAGVGWIGKNSCVIHPELGSWVFLSEIICSLPLDPDVPAFDQCGSCSLCLEACPTHALVAPGVLDATRCISYLTIEHRGDIPEELGADIGTHVFGCDICQEVCPWNQAAPISEDPHWQPRPAWDACRGTSSPRPTS